MKLLVFSDSHGSTFAMREALRRVRDVDYVIHAGDGAPDLFPIAQEFSVTPAAVRGNCDLAASLPLEETLTVEGARVLIVHGHRYGVKFSFAQLIADARRRSFDLVIFGHTHERCEQYVPAENGLPAVYLFNPGTARAGDFGVIDIRGKNILMSHGSVYDLG